MSTLEPAIDTMIQATNRRDNKAFLSAFAEDAVLTDFGRTFRGKAEIARWNDAENIGVQSIIRVTGVSRSGKKIKVAIVVSGNGYNGSGTFTFELVGSVIQSLLIA